jgi:predicted transcriptional regulator
MKILSALWRRDKMLSEHSESDQMARKNTAKITFTCPPEMKEELENLAEAERRTVSNLVEGIVFEWLESRKVSVSESKSK